MDWFSNWWDTLPIVEQILYCVAIPATIILLIQTILLVIGFGGAGESPEISDTSGLDIGDSIDIGIDAMTDSPQDMDISGDSPGDFPNEMGTLSLFTVQGIVSFLCIFSWSGIVLTGFLHIVLALLIAVGLGFLAMLGVAEVIRYSARLAQNGTINMKILLGETGTVYIPVPASGGGFGKVTVQLAERFVECDAVNEGENFLPTNTAVRITDILSGNVLVVERLE